MTKTLLLASELTSAFPKLETFLSGNGSNLLFIPTAATGEGWSPDHFTHVRPFEKMGFNVVEHDLSKGKEPLPEGYSINDFAAVYVCGGNTFFLMSHMRRTGMDRLLTEAVNAGELIYIGSSAGTVAATPDISYAAAIDDPGKGDGTEEGLGLVGFAILPHIDHPEMGEAAMACFTEWDHDLPVYGLRDENVILIEGRRIRML
jgi:Peptidase E